MTDDAFKGGIMPELGSNPTLGDFQRYVETMKKLQAIVLAIPLEAT